MAVPEENRSSLPPEPFGQKSSVRLVGLKQESRLVPDLRTSPEGPYAPSATPDRSLRELLA